MNQLARDLHLSIEAAEKIRVSGQTTMDDLDGHRMLSLQLGLGYGEIDGSHGALSDKVPQAI